MTLHPSRVALVLGSFVALIHLVWSFFVAVGFAQPLLNFIYKFHFLNNPFTVQEFDPLGALVLVSVTFGVAYVGGFVFAWLWNKVNGKR